MKFKGFYQSDAIYSGLPVAACKPLTQGGIPTWRKNAVVRWLFMTRHAVQQTE